MHHSRQRLRSMRGPVAAPQARNTTVKADIHPKYEAVTATCSCGNTIQTRSTLGEDFLIDVCSQCHPFFTGKQKIVDSGGRVDRFKKRFGSRGATR
jgi:large subunit ribosomal protein L31